MFQIKNMKNFVTNFVTKQIIKGYCVGIFENAKWHFHQGFSSNPLQNMFKYVTLKGVKIK